MSQTSVCYLCPDEKRCLVMLLDPADDDVTVQAWQNMADLRGGNLCKHQALYLGVER